MHSTRAAASALSTLLGIEVYVNGQFTVRQSKLAYAVLMCRLNCRRAQLGVVELVGEIHRLLMMELHSLGQRTGASIILRHRRLLLKELLMVLC